MPTEFLRFAEYGYLGLCLIMLWVIWTLIKQNRNDAKEFIQALRDNTMVMTSIKTLIEERLPRRG